jgi:hypothetical protein
MVLEKLMFPELPKTSPYNFTETTFQEMSRLRNGGTR